MVERYPQQADYTPEFTRPLNELIECASGIPRGEPFTFGATPLDKLSTIDQQVQLLNELIHYTYSIPEGVSLEVADYVHQTFRDRFYSRMNANDENYMTSLVKKSHYEDSEAVSEMIARAETGHASPAELLIVQKLLGIRSVELACLTHPYGERMEPFLDEMRFTVTESVQALDGECVPEPEERYRIKDVILKNVPEEKWAEVYTLSNKDRLDIADQYGGVIGLLVTRKRDLGYMPDGTVVRERSSLVFRMDVGETITAEALEQLQNTPSEDWVDTALQASGLDVYISRLMQENQNTVAIPIASTIYAFNHAIAEKVYAAQPASGELPFVFDMERAEAAIADLRRDHEVRQYGDMIYINKYSTSNTPSA